MYKNTEFFVGQLPDLHFSDNSYDVICIFYVLHDVSENFRDGIVKEFLRILKPGGKLFIKEPQRINDGIPVSEIKRLMSNNNFKEVSGKEKKGTFSGIYIKEQ